MKVEKTVRALELRKAGASYRAIAAQLGWKSADTAYKVVTRALRVAAEDAAGDALKLEIARLDDLQWSMQVVLHKELKSGNLTQQGFAAADRMLKIIELRAKLGGYKAPERSQVSVVGANGQVLAPVILVPPMDPPDGADVDITENSGAGATSDLSTNTGG